MSDDELFDDGLPYGGISHQRVVLGAPAAAATVGERQDPSAHATVLTRPGRLGGAIVISEAELRAADEADELAESYRRRSFSEKAHRRAPKGTPTGGQFVKKGDDGDLVKAIQRIVGVEDDGQYGPKTEAAIRDLQRKHGLKVDGIVGRQTAQQLIYTAADLDDAPDGARPASKVKPGKLTADERRLIGVHGRNPRNRSSRT